jgi:transcriptional regulator with XRE-family HTH domain
MAGWLDGAFGSILRERRDSQHMSQDQLAQAAGLSRTSVVNIEKGRQGVSLDSLYKLASALGCQPGDLLPSAPSMDLPKITIGDQSAESRLAIGQVMNRVRGMSKR